MKRVMLAVVLALVLAACSKDAVKSVSKIDTTITKQAEKMGVWK